MKGCNASAIFRGDQNVKEHYDRPFKTNRGGDANRCQHCNALRFPGERDSLCCQKGKVRLDKVPEPTPILKQLLEDRDPRSKVFKTHIIPLNCALQMVSLRVRHKKAPHGNFQPQVMIQGRAYYYIAPLETEENAWSGLYVHDPEQKGAARTNALTYRLEHHSK